jgi:hypothetical protein
LEVNPETGVPVETISEALDGLVGRVSKAWGKIDECFVDLPNFSSSGRLDDGTHPVTNFFSEARLAELIAIPVTGLDRDAAYQAAVVSAAAAGRKGIAIRLRRGDLSDPTGLTDRIEALCSDVGVEPAEVDLLLDFGEVTASVEASIRAEAESALRALPKVQEWRSLTLAAGAFPAQPSSFIDAGDSGLLPRRDWNLWHHLFGSDPPLPRTPAFGDYGVTNPSWLQYDPIKMTRTANIRYTTDRDWLLLRGRSLEVPGAFAQFHGLSKDLLARVEFFGADHCWGDQEIRDCSKRSTRPGSLTSWRAVGTRHHIEVVSQQLTSLT